MNRTDQSAELARIDRAAAFIKESWPQTPDVLLVLGSGLGKVAEQLLEPIVIPYSEIPGFWQTTVPGHQGRLLWGQWQGRQVAVMQGRLHYYEGHSLTDVVLPIRVMQRLGVKRLILTNAAGGIKTAMSPGDLMLIKDHIGLFAESPLRGPNMDQFGPRFPDQSFVYDRDWQKQARQLAKSLAIDLSEGVYAWAKGPQFETPAEIRALRILGADAVGMSTVPEAVAACHAGMKILGLSCITNMAAGILDQPLTHAEVIKVGLAAAAGLTALLGALVKNLGD